MGSPVCVARLRVTNATGFFDSLNPEPTGESVRLRFTVTRSLRTEPNTAEIDVYNLAPLTTGLVTGVVRSRSEWTASERAQLKLLGTAAVPLELISETFGLGAIELSWGFTDSELYAPIAALSVGFEGQSSKMRSAKDGNDVILKIEAEDGAHLLGGGEAIQIAGGGVVPYEAKSYKTGTSIIDIVADLVASCGLTVNKATLTAQVQAAMLARGLSPADIAIIGGYNTSGPARPQIEQFMTALGLRWSVQNGELLILDETSVIPGLPPLVLSSELGNVFGEPEAIDATRLAVSTWAQPDAVPGRQVTLITPDRVTNYRIETATTEVDTRSGGQTSLQLAELQTIPGVF